MESSAVPFEETRLPDINLFVLQNGRFPRIGDSVAPWKFRGWLLYQVQLVDTHPQLPGRWMHYLRTLEAGHLLAEPIPRVEFELANIDAGRNMLERCLKFIHQEEQSWTSFERLVEWLAWGLAVSGEAPRLHDGTKEALYRTFNLEPLLLHPHDYLGWMLAERHSNGWNPNAFFPTPHPVVELMVQMTVGGGGEESDHVPAQDRRLKQIMDPCVGTGRMLLHASNYSYCLYGCDIDPVVAMITRINGALYAPWLAFPFPQKILGVPLPPPPPADLPISNEQLIRVHSPMFRVDDRGQGLLF